MHDQTVPPAPTAPGILFVAPRFHTNLFFATKALVEAGYRVAVFAQMSQPPEDHRFVTPRIFPRGTPYRPVRDAVRAFRPDLVLSRWTRPASFHVERAGRFGKLNIWHYDLRPLTSHRSWLKRAEWWAQGLPARRVTPKPGLDRNAPAEPSARYLPWPVAAEPGQPRGLRGDGPLRVLCVGKLMQPRKNQDKLIAAMRGLLDDERAVLTLVGAVDVQAARVDADHYATLKAAAQDSKGRITLLEDLPYADMPALYARHDVCVLPARGEPLGFAPLEAMAYGCVPVIGTGCGAAGYLTDGVDGFRVRSGDVPALCDVLTRLASDPALVERVGQAARHLTETELSPARFIDRIGNLMAQSGHTRGT
ncbi:MAG: glycosyltransferase family 4 protein [Qingshengfaniella sp.]